MKLTAAAVRGMRTPGKYADADGLFLHVTAPERRYWMFRFQHRGRRRTMSFGDADVVTLAQARALHMEARALLARGSDPLAEREAARPRAVTFAEAMEAYLAAHGAGWRGRRAVEVWRASMVWVLPVLGGKPVAEVGVEDVLRSLSPIWTTKPVLASRVRGRIEGVLDYALARKWREGENPARWKGGLKPLLPAPGKIHTVEHHAALPWQEVPALMATLAAEPSMAAKCLRFLILTATRSAEGREAAWDEIDMQTGTWVIPARRTKLAREHRVALSEAALGVLHEVAPTRGAEPVVFFGRWRGRPVSGMALTELLRRLGHAEATVHGFRSSFRDWCADTGKPWHAAEAALGHVVATGAVAAYQRSDLLEARRPLMAAWADYVTREPGGVVVPMRAAG
jgi:integrase